MSGAWMWLSGVATGLACGAAARGDWWLFAFFLAWAVGALAVALRGMGPEETTCRHDNRMADGTASYRRARLALVRKEG